VGVADVSLGTSGAGFGIGITEVGYDDLNKLRFYSFGAFIMGGFVFFVIAFLFCCSGGLKADKIDNS
jgi:hypothetical protein